jgi:hypothetical protein
MPFYSVNIVKYCKINEIYGESEEDVRKQILDINWDENIIDCSIEVRKHGTKDLAWGIPTSWKFVGS